MTAAGSRVVTDFDHHSPEHGLDPWRSFDALRQRCPVAYSEQHGGYWVVTGWDEVAQVARNPETFSSAVQPEGRSIHIPTDGVRAPRPPLELDPPEFVAYRRLLDPYCSPKAIEEMEPGIAFWADYFIDRFIEDGSVNVVAAFGTAVPSAVTIDWLGLPPESWHFYWESMDALHHVRPGTEEAARAQRGLDELIRVLEEEIEARRAAPRGDLLSAIANAEVNGAPMTLERAVGTTLLLIAGGTGTTADLFSHALVDLSDRRDVHRALLEDDRLMRTATEEYLRVSTPVLSIGRFAAADAEIGGCPVAKGDHVLIAWGAANRDPAVFEDPGTVVLDRWPNHHLSFGLGPHRCVGSNLGRTLFKIMVRRFLERAPDFRVTDCAPIENRSLFSSLARVEVEFTPGERLQAEATPTPQFRVAGTPYTS